MSFQLGVLLIVRDEIDVIRKWIKYYFSQGVDYIFATDNGSVDGTLEVLQKYERQGRLHLTQEPVSDYAMHKWFTRMARLAATEYPTEWLLCCDADEFVVPPDGKSISDIVRGFPPDWNCFAMQKSDFVDPGFSPGDFVPETQVYRKRVSLNPFGTQLPSKAGFRPHPGVEVGQGGHQIVNLHCEQQDCLQIYHYPARGYKHFAQRILNAGLQYRNNSELPKSVGGVKRLWLEMYEQGTLEQHYQEHKAYSPEKLQRDLQNGELIEDRRLLELMKEIQP